jgi:hypothetical protein
MDAHVDSWMHEADDTDIVDDDDDVSVALCVTLSFRVIDCSKLSSFLLRSFGNIGGCILMRDDDDDDDDVLLVLSWKFNDLLVVRLLIAVLLFVCIF